MPFDRARILFVDYAEWILENLELFVGDGSKFKDFPEFVHMYYPDGSEFWEDAHED